MTSSRSTTFCKNEDCPTSQDLLDFQNGEIDRERGVDIRIHMGMCEFCSAEVEFYSRFPQVTDDTEEVTCTIPEPLFELANALLRNPHGKPGFGGVRRRMLPKEFSRNVF